jgi:hypothetical protein
MNGIDVHKLKPGIIILAVTRNSLYKIIKKEGRNVIVQGGKKFIEPKEVIFLGSSIRGGSSIKIGWIGYGMKMEMCDDSNNYITSIVLAARLIGDGWEYEMNWDVPDIIQAHWPI